MITDQPLVSIVIPAYNEERRLPESLAIIGDYIAQQPYRTEVLVVDDGSTDATGTVAERLSSVRVLRCQHRGKGSAVRTGALAASGEYVLVCDADLAVPITEWDKLWHFLKNGYDIAIGSREGIGATRIAEPRHRHLMGRAFNLIVRSVAVSGIQDTQCGFKALRRSVAVDLFNRMHVYGANTPPIQHPAVTAYDVELLFVARRRHYRIMEVPVVWRYGQETKVRPIRDSLTNLRDVIRMRLNDLRGCYADNCARSLREPQPLVDTIVHPPSKTE